ncbi:Pol I core factor CF [Mortierella sp. 14UC]|nr:Pol I core factor CF [Mortierella sp. 14UC]
MGQYVCEFGHILEGYQEEEGEYMEGAGYERVQKKRKVAKVAKAGVYHGLDATTLILRCVQLILQLQAQALVRDLKFPREIVGVIQEYWTVYVSFLVEYHDELRMGLKGGVQGDTAEDQRDQGQLAGENTESKAENEEVIEADFKDKTEPATPNRDLLDKEPEYQPTDSESSDNDDDGEEDEVDKGADNVENESANDEDVSGSEDDDVETVIHGATPDMDDDSEATQLTEAGALNVDDFEEYLAKELTDPLQQFSRAKKSTHGRISDRRPGVLNNRGRTDYRYLSMRFNIAILYIASLHLKIPVVIGDFQRWIMRHDIPFFNAIKYLPGHMEKRLPPAYRHFLQPNSRNPERLRRAVNALLQHFEKWHSIGSVLPNAPRLIARFLHELMLPVECYACALRFYHIAYNDIHTKQARRKLGFRSTLRGPDYAMAITVVVAKLVYGLYGESRNVKDWQYWINSLPTEKEWITSLDSFDAVRTQSEIPHMQAEFEELINVNPDLYSKHYGKELRMVDPRDYLERMKMLNVLDETFNTTGSSTGSTLIVAREQQNQQPVGERQKPKKNQPAMEVPYIQRLYSDVKPASHLADEKGPLGRQMYVRYYSDPKGQLLGNYARLLGYASNILCIPPEELEKEVQFIEEQLFFKPSKGK